MLGSNPAVLTVNAPIPTTDEDCCQDVGLRWPSKNTLDDTGRWFSAEAYCAAVGQNVVQFSYQFTYGDGKLVVLQQQNTAQNVVGFLFSQGTPGCWYLIQVTAVLTDNQRVNWTVALVINYAIAVIEKSSVTANDAVLVFAGQTISVPAPLPPSSPTAFPVIL